MEKIYPTCDEAPQITTYIYTKLIKKKKKASTFSILSHSCQCFGIVLYIINQTKTYKILLPY
jgi:hypothetical protein